jgi:hypothetical protein
MGGKMSPERTESIMQAARGVSRRSFLKVGSIGVAAAGVASVVPGVGAALGLASAETPELTDVGTEVGGDAASALSGDAGAMVLHVSDSASGEMSLYVGEREVVFRDPSLLDRLVNVAR